MKKKFRRFIKRFYRYVKETFMNKLAALMMFIIGWLTAKVSGDGTGLVFITIFFVIPLLLEKRSCFK